MAAFSRSFIDGRAGKARITLTSFMEHPMATRGFEASSAASAIARAPLHIVLAELMGIRQPSLPIFSYVI